MKIKIIVIGNTDASWLAEACSIYEKRLKHYIGFEQVVIPNLKNAAKLTEAQIKEKEGELLLSILQPADEVVLLDEAGKLHSSEDFAGFLSKKMTASVQSLVFVIGGAYGFSEQVYNRATSLFSLSPMTFTHQMIRLLFLEQLYRAFTIIKGESYHHR